MAEVAKGNIGKFGVAKGEGDRNGVENKNGVKMVKLDLANGVQRLTFDNPSTSNHDKEQLNTPQGEQLRASDLANSNLDQLSLKDSEHNFLKPDSARPEGGSPTKPTGEKLKIPLGGIPRKKGTRGSKSPSKSPTKSPKKSPSKVSRIGSGLLGIKIPGDVSPKKSKTDGVRYDPKSMLSLFTMKVGQTELNKERKRNFPDHVMKFLKPHKAKKCEKWVPINDMLNTGGSALSKGPPADSIIEKFAQNTITEQEDSISKKSQTSAGKLGGPT